MTETPISLKAAQKTVEQVDPPRIFTEQNKRELTDRLRREGRWEEFGKRRDEIRIKLKHQGADKDERVNQSWVQALAELPPLPVVKELKEPAWGGKMPEEAPLTPETLARFEAVEFNVEADIAEASHKLAQSRLTAEDFARPLAWRFWRVAKMNPANEFRFLNEHVVKFLGKRQDEDDASKPDERDEELGGLMTAMGKEFPVEGAKEACPACSVMLQLPDSLRTGDDSKSPEFHLRRA